MRLLVVEDEARIVELLQSAFQRAGFVVDAVGPATAGRDALSLVPYDAIILDLGLPDGDGLQLLATARRGGNNVPILILTARDAVEDRVGGLDAGADDYLVKPFAVTELISRIKALLRRPGHALGMTLEAGNLAFDRIGRHVRVDTPPIAPRRRALWCEAARVGGAVRAVRAVGYAGMLAAQSLGDDELERRAVQIAQFVARGPDGALHLTLPARLDQLYHSPARTRLLAVRSSDGAMIAASAPEFAAAVAPWPPPDGNRHPFPLHDFGPTSQ